MYMAKLQQVSPDVDDSGPIFDKEPEQKEKGDECIFVGYSTQSSAYRVFNKRTRVIMESIHVNFNELPHQASVHNSTDPAPTRQEMASVHNSTDPGPTCQKMASVQISSDPAPEC
nr:Gag-Pol polyprotein [Tanacetum cinerariifolium]